MSALITVQDVEDALGREAEDSEEIAQWQYYINVISLFINNFVDVSFEPLVLVTERLRADQYGQIKLKSPVNDVTSVKNFRTQEEDLYVDFDGIDLLMYLEPRQVVDVTYSYGYNVVPDDIHGLVLTLVLEQVNEIAPVNLKSHQVGDVVDVYAVTSVGKLFDQFAMDTLQKYATTQFTINTSAAGSDSFPDYTGGQAYVNDF